MKRNKFRKLKITYISFWCLWTLVVVVSAFVNGLSPDGSVILKSLVAHSVVWLTALVMTGYNYKTMTRALGNRENLAARLRATIESTEELIDVVPFGVTIINRDKLVIKANLEARRILGKEPEEIIGRVCHQNICPAQVGHCPILDEKQGVDHSEKTAIGPLGEEIPIQKTAIPFNWRGEDVLLETFVDISERKVHEREMKNNLADIQKFNRLATGRELKMIELKKEVNELMEELGEPRRYKIVTMETPGVMGE